MMVLLMVNGNGISGMISFRVKNMLLRKIIYMGECGEGTVYFDTQKQLALLAPSSSLLSTAGASITNKAIPILIGVFMFGLGLKTTNPFGGHYSHGTLVFLIVLWLLEFFGFVWLMEMALYRNVKYAQPTSRRNFRVAVYGNLVWNNFGDKKATIGKKCLMSGVVLIMLFLNMAFLPILHYSVLPDVMSHAKIDSGIILLSLWGIIPAILVLLIWQNNPIRFLNIVGQYQKRQLKWGQETNRID